MHDLDQLLKNYESANNSHDWNNVAPFVHKNATYFFTDGTFTGIDEIQKAVSDTFAKIQNEKYTVNNIQWPVAEEHIAVCIYNFQWKGTIDGNPAEGSGRGTNIWIKTDDNWQIIHEHLSA